MDQGPEQTVKSTCLHRLHSCLPWADWYQYLLQPHYCWFRIRLHFAQAIWMLIFLLSFHACLLPSSGVSSLPLPTLRALLWTLLGVHRDCVHQAPSPQCGKIPWQLGSLPLATARHEKVPPLSCNAVWSWQSPGMPEPLHRAWATRPLFRWQHQQCLTWWVGNRRGFGEFCFLCNI